MQPTRKGLERAVAGAFLVRPDTFECRSQDKWRMGIMEREYLLGALVKEVLGPRGGPHEVLALDRDPKNEYIVGVLAPKQSDNTRDVDADAALLEDGTIGEGDEDVDGDITASFSPSLDPKALPRSLGLSFTVVPADGAKLDVCCTWARYKKDGGWKRVPYFDIKTFDIPVVQRYEASAVDPGIRFVCTMSPVAGGKYKVSVFMVNDTPLRDREWALTEHCIFQPEIRVVCVNCRLVPVDSDVGEYTQAQNEENVEELSLRLLYHNRLAYARGHLVGATWKDIDPQQPAADVELPDFPPFKWIDSEVLPSEVAARFANCDVRTDYTPMYPVPAPSMFWRDEFGPQPELDPVVLSETWNPAELRRKLEPFVSGYERWLDKEILRAKPLESKFGPAIKKHVDEIRQSIARIQRSIDLLCSDEWVRLAFCFANKVMALQSEWAVGRVNRWRPFQLAFILQNVCSVAKDDDPDRETADLLWFATGGGKTEAYLGLAIFTVALKRLLAPIDSDGHRKGAGVNVLSRYTLRLLTIQQFRRALRVITAAEYLRVFGLNPWGNAPVGWRPQECLFTQNYLWGSERISIGLWVGGSVTPKSLLSFRFPDDQGNLQPVRGAVEILEKGGQRSDGEPAQVITCPCCGAYLAIPNEGLGHGRHKLHWVIKAFGKVPDIVESDIELEGVSISEIRVQTLQNTSYHTISIAFEVPEGHQVKPEMIDALWWNCVKPKLGDSVRLVSSRPTRQGYFIRKYLTSRRTESPNGFDLYCPNPECDLNKALWAEKAPVSVGAQQLSSSADMEFQEIFEPFRVPGFPSVSSRVPIPAYTVDDQIYHRCPSMIVATADKFAQLPMEPKAAAIFGNVEYYHARWGYYREMCPPSYGANGNDAHPPGFSSRSPLHKRVEPFDPPCLIIQDELHLIEGPLGSLYGLYETVVDELCTKYAGGNRIRPKYVLSTATVRQAQHQVGSLYVRKLAQFPAHGLSVEDNFFSTMHEIHPADSAGPGRLYVGICAPGKGAQTPLVRIWSALLQAAQDLRVMGARNEDLDGFWTLVGYFNAMRELAGALSLYRQDIPERIHFIADGHERHLVQEALELSARRDSMELPGLLERLSVGLMQGTPEDAVFATSMFGTGMDVDRLRLMVINGQPKSASTYIQASGRVGRKAGGLVVTFFRASRPRDLDHYEFFTGYHRALYKNVEPVTVFPFSPRARERALGPISVAVLRNARRIQGVRVAREWRPQQKSGQKLLCGATHMSHNRHCQEINSWIKLLEDRLIKQPPSRRPDVSQVIRELRSELDRWHILAQKHAALLYYESSMAKQPQHAVVLGDQSHYFRNLDMAFENVPQSLRDVEGTITFQT